MRCKASPRPTAGNYSEARQTWDAGIRGRLGYLLDPTLLLYVTGGMQWQHFTATENCAINACSPPPLPPNGAPYLQTNSTTRAGWTVGGGIEKMLRDRWLIRAEYRYADFRNLDHELWRDAGHHQGIRPGDAHGVHRNRQKILK